MEITGALVMAADTVLLPVHQLSDELRRQVQAEEGDFAITRPHSRTSARIVDANAARLLEEFRQPTTVIQAILRYCGANREDPESTLDAAFPMLERLVVARLLVPTGAPEAESIRPLLEVGSRFEDTEVLAAIQTIEDTDVYRVRTSSGQIAALKLMRSSAHREVAAQFEREAFILQHLDASVTPSLLGSSTSNEPRYLLLSWCDGSNCATVAAGLREAADRTALLRLGVAILRAYAHLHSQKVIHSDVHPGNILVDEDGSVHLVDFGLARIADAAETSRPGLRGGVGYYLDPEYASSMRLAQRPPLSSALGEQYSLAALLYLLFAGKHYADFSLEQHEMERQIVEEAPLPFRAQQIEPWPAVEAVLVRALRKKPEQRFPSVDAFAAALALAGKTGSQRSSLRNRPVAFSTAQMTLQHMLARLDGAAPLLQTGVNAPTASVTYGSGGIACALHRIACARRDPRILALADLWAERAARDSHLEDAWSCPSAEITPELVGKVSPYHTASGVSLVSALIANATGDLQAQQNAVNEFIAASAAPCEKIELTLGRSGTLLAAAQLIAALAPGRLIDLAGLRELGDATLSSIWQEVDACAPIRECPQIRSTGVAHGWAGILYATLCYARATGATLPQTMGERLDQLASVAQHSGRQAWWSLSLDAPSPARAPLTASWCNGSAGQVHLWLAAHAALNEDRYLLLANAAARHTADTGSASGSLCCGLTGQAYALLALYKRSGERNWLHRAQDLGERAAIAFNRKAPGAIASHPELRPESLYKGELGVAVLAADLESPETSALPAFELIEF